MGQGQARLLEASWRRVRAGGRLVYAVCSLEPEEGSAQVRSFAEAKGLRITAEGAWTPEEHGCDGFYAARIEAGAARLGARSRRPEGPAI